MTDSRNVFCRFFYILVMLHKIMHSHFTDWNNKRKRKALGAGIYALTILPELLLLNGTLFAAAGQDGYVHLESDCQKVVFYGVSVLALLLMAIPWGFLDDKKIRKEVRQELRERPRYWKRAMLIYIAAIVALVVAVNIAFPTASENTVPAEKEKVEVPQSYRDYLSLHFKIGARQEAPNEALQRQIDQDERTTRYGQPVYAMQVRATKGDMDGGFRARLLNHATIDEIRDGTRKCAECTWVKGYTSDSIRILLTVWYKMKKVELCPVDSLEWTEDTGF